MLKLSFPLGTVNYDTFSVFEERPGKFVPTFPIIPSITAADRKTAQNYCILVSTGC